MASRCINLRYIETTQELENLNLRLVQRSKLEFLTFLTFRETMSRQCVQISKAALLDALNTFRQQSVNICSIWRQYFLL